MQIISKVAFFSILAFPAVYAYAAPINVLPVSQKEGAQSLNGDWKFKYIAAAQAGSDASFQAPTFDVSGWKSIPVPSNWELQGFAAPKYDLELEEGLGLYRRSFRVPVARNDGRRVCLRFEGVAFGFEVWVNGVSVGTSAASAFNPNTFDITNALRPNGDNVLAVLVKTKPKGYEFDVNDDWSLSGIFRDVTLFSVPDVHFQDLTARTHLTNDGAADLSVSVAVNQAEGEVRGKLLAPNGQTVTEFTLSRGANGQHEGVVRVVQPQLWTAETPALYRLQLSLWSKGKKLQSREDRIGLREITIAEGVLRLNGRPIKLRGVNHHDISPLHGRAITEAEMRRDLKLMKRGNINFVRTSHYPPNARFLDLCDEMGFYVDCEVPIGKGEEHLNDASYRDTILARVAPTITRDKNHASVMVWSIGNENPITDVEFEAGRRAKELDPTRPICFPKVGSYFAKNYERFPEFVDIYSPHYPSNTTLRDYASTLKRPLILTEYAHALGLATDRIQDQWEILQTTPNFAGGAIWHFQDQGLLRSQAQPVERDKPTKHVWLDAHRFYDTNNEDGADGIVYADRTPQTDFWEARQVYAPVQISQRFANVKVGLQEIALTVENRYDFRSLAGMKLAWSLQRNGKTFGRGNVPLRAMSHGQETVRIPLTIPADAAGDVLALALRCLDEKGQQITERTVRLDLAGASRDQWFQSLPVAGQPHVVENEAGVTVELPKWNLNVARSNGVLTIRDRAGRLVVAGIYPHPSRKLTMAEELSAEKSGIWRTSTLTHLDAAEIKVTQEGSNVTLGVSGHYARPEDPTQEFLGGYQAEIAPNGAITIRYNYAPTAAKGRLTEAGLSLVLPAAMTEFRWIGQGPYAGYPGKDRLNEFGTFHLNREDLRFQGNRRETEVALLTTPGGLGVALATTAADVAVERAGDQVLLSHNAVISGLGNKGSSPETGVGADKTPQVAGSFTLVPLDEKWPLPLKKWFGEPGAAREVLRPFYHSYDQ